MEALAVAQETMVVMVLMAVATALALGVLAAAEVGWGRNRWYWVFSDQQVRAKVQEQAAQAVRLYQELQER